MSVMKRARRQRAVWWARQSMDRFGQWTFTAPVEVKCRWDDTAQAYLSSLGEDLTSRALVYPDRVMALGDRLMRGEMDSNTPDDPMSLQTTFEIKRFDQNPDFKAKEFWYTAYL